MLDVMRKHSRSFIIYVFFGIIISVFIINFGPQSAGCTATTSHAARVEGQPITQAIFNHAVQSYSMRLAQLHLRLEDLREPAMVQLRSTVMDQLLVRELLAEDALKLGFRISDKEIDDMLVKGRYLSIGSPQLMDHAMQDGKFDYDKFSRFVRFSTGMNVLKFKEEQRRELLAEKMKQYLAGLVKASEDEVQADYMVRNSQTELNYVRFAPYEHRGRVELDEAKIKSWLTANKKRVDDYYKDNKASFQKLPKQVKLQILRLDGQAKAEAALKQLKAGEPFAKVALAESTHESKAEGGMLGWRSEENPGLDPDLNKAVAGLKTGELSGVLKGKDGVYVVKVLGRRSGDQSLAQVEMEIAEDLYRSEEALKLAKQDAESFIKRAKAGEKLSDMFTAEDSTDKSSSESGEEGKTDEAAKKPAGPKSPLKLASTSMFARSGRFLVPGIGVSKEVMTAAFKLKKGQVADQPFVVGQLVYLIAVADRKDADPAEWAKRRDEITDSFINQKAGRVIREYARARCEAAIKDHDINVNPGALVTPGYVPDKKEPLPTFAPCSSLQERTAQ